MKIDRHPNANIWKSKWKLFFLYVKFIQFWLDFVFFFLQRIFICLFFVFFEWIMCPITCSVFICVFYHHLCQIYFFCMLVFCWSYETVVCTLFFILSFFYFFCNMKIAMANQQHLSVDDQLFTVFESLKMTNQIIAIYHYRLFVFFLFFLMKDSKRKYIFKLNVISVIYYKKQCALNWGKKLNLDSNICLFCLRHLHFLCDCRKLWFLFLSHPFYECAPTIFFIILILYFSMFLFVFLFMCERSIIRQLTHSYLLFDVASCLSIKW